jgi:hypothetical protein
MSEDRGREIRTKLTGARIPSLLCPDYDGRLVDLDAIARNALVLYLQPGRIVSGDRHADEHQHDTYRMLRHRFAATMPDGSAIAALSTAPDPMSFVSAELQTPEATGDHQILHYLLDDTGLGLAKELPLPTFERDEMRLYDRITFVVMEGIIKKVFYPVIAGQDARQALTWLQLR